jgi:hypothetical protein
VNGIINMRLKSLLSIALAMSAIGAAQAAAELEWVSPNRYRVLLTVNSRDIKRSNSPAKADIDFPKALKDAGGRGDFDGNTIEVVAYDSSGKPRTFDSSQDGYEKLLVPCRTQKYYQIDSVTLSFVMPDETCSRYAVYFDTKDSGHGKPQRYSGLVGDGDKFTEGYKRREIAACLFDCFADFDGDGDLDLFVGGTPSTIQCYENEGGGRFVDKGQMTSAGKPFLLTPDGGRAWATLTFDDWDGDGDQDLFVTLGDGPERIHLLRYENIKDQWVPLTLVPRGPVLSVNGSRLGSDFAAATFVDWDGDGRRDLMLTRNGMLEFHRNLAVDKAIVNMRFDDGAYVKANGANIVINAARFDFADIDSDGDLDAFAASGEGNMFWFENVGTRTNPVLATGRIIAFFEFLDALGGIKVADFDGDGLLDLAAGRFWERTNWPEQPRLYGCFYKNVGTKTKPRFELRDAYHGGLYTEQFHPCDAVRQNGVRAADWNGDGKTDLIASDTDGYTWFFRNTTNNLFPVYAAGEKLKANGEIIRVPFDLRWCGYARSDVADWNNDGLLDLIVGDIYGRYTVFSNRGSKTSPVLAEGITQATLDGKEIRGDGRATPLVCDFDNDGKKDLVGGEDGGIMFYRNVGTDDKPKLSPAQTILGRTQIQYPRPNMGSFVDWDGDGKKDLLIGEFENKIRFLRNIGSSEPGAVPRFADANGVVLVSAEGGSTQLVSGVDAKDFNGDGDVDILTGQGHGGSNLRFYEHDYVDDWVNGTFPVVALGKAEKRE